VKNELILFFFLLLITAWSEETIIQEYRAKLLEVNALLTEHEALGMEINDNLQDTTANKQKIDAYLAWAAANKEALASIKTFIEEHHKELKGQTPDPIITRDTLKLLLEDIERNEQNFQRYNKIWERYN